jgi:hypothetical protein
MKLIRNVEVDRKQYKKVNVFVRAGDMSATKVE